MAKFLGQPESNLINLVTRQIALSREVVPHWSAGVLGAHYRFVFFAKDAARSKLEKLKNGCAIHCRIAVVDAINNPSVHLL